MLLCSWVVVVVGCPQFGQNSIVESVWPQHIVQNCMMGAAGWNLRLVSSRTTRTTARVTSATKPSAAGIRTPRSLVSKPLFVFSDFGCPLDGGVVGPVCGGFVPGFEAGGLLEPPDPVDPADPLTWRMEFVVRSAWAIHWPICESRNCHETRIVRL